MVINRYTKIALTIALALAGRHIVAMNAGDYTASSTGTGKAAAGEAAAPIIAAPGSLEEQLIEACRMDNHDKIRSLIARGADINAQDKDGHTPLTWAAWNRNIEIVQRLIVDKNANVNAQNKIGYTPLLVAARRNNLAIVQLLVGKGANVNAQDQCGETPLIFAASHGNLAMVQLLVTSGADVNAQDKYYGNTALDMANLSRHDDVVEYLAPLIAPRQTLFALLAGEECINPAGPEEDFPPEHVWGMLKPMITAAILDK